MTRCTSGLIDLWSPPYSPTHYKWKGLHAVVELASLVSVVNGRNNFQLEWRLYRHYIKFKGAPECDCGCSSWRLWWWWWWCVLMVWLTRGVVVCCSAQLGSAAASHAPHAETRHAQWEEISLRYTYTLTLHSSTYSMISPPSPPRFSSRLCACTC